MDPVISLVLTMGLVYLASKSRLLSITMIIQFKRLFQTSNSYMYLIQLIKQCLLSWTCLDLDNELNSFLVKGILVKVV